MPAANPETMQCMEVWGGNVSVDSSVTMAGLDAWVFCKPYSPPGSAAAALAGGDVYFVSSCATGRITRLLVADVSGHGAVVGAVAGSLRTLMRKYVNFLDPCRFVGEMNRNFEGLSKSGCFATAVVTTFFAPTHHVTFCNAGHPPPLLYRAGKGWTFLEAQAVDDESVVDLPLGIEDGSDYRQSDTHLRTGDLVLCYTDALPESRDANSEYLGQRGLLEIVKTIDVSDPARVVPLLTEAITKLHPGNLDGDDVTILLFRPNGLGEKASLGNKLKAPLRIAGAVIKSLFPGGGPAPWPDRHPANVGGAIFDRFNQRWGGQTKKT